MLGCEQIPDSVAEYIVRRCGELLAEQILWVFHRSVTDCAVSLNKWTVLKVFAVD